MNQPSVASTDDILNGNGAQAGLTQVIAQRLQADQGAGGLGRLTFRRRPASTVTISGRGSPFGFQLAGVNSSLTGATVTGPSGRRRRSISIDLGSNPNAGDSIQFSLTLPDGSSQTITLQATTASPPGANQFTIGATAADTATNLQTALTGAISTLAQTALPAASAIAASNNFFQLGSAAAGRPAPPYDTATSLVNGTTANTVFWYTGENGSTPARQTATAQVGPSMTDRLRHARQRAGDHLAGRQCGGAGRDHLFGKRSECAGELSGAVPERARQSQRPVGHAVDQRYRGRPRQRPDNRQNASTLNTQTQTTLQDMLQGIEGINQNQIGEQILTLQNTLSASMSVTARLAQLSLVNFLAPSSG